MKEMDSLVPLPPLERLSLTAEKQRSDTREPRTLLTLPTEILEQIFSHLPDISLHAVSLTCKRIQTFAHSDHLWHCLLSNLHLTSPHPYPSYRRLHRALAPHLFLPRKLFFGDREVHGHLLVCKYLSLTGTIEAFALIEDKPRSKRGKTRAWSQDPMIKVHGFNPKVRIWEETELKISPDSRKSPSGEIPQPRAARGIFASFVRAKAIVGDDVRPNMGVWPPFCIPTEERVRNQSVTKFNDPGHNPSAIWPSQIATGAAAAALPPMGNIDEEGPRINITPFDSPPPAVLEMKEKERWLLRQPAKTGYASEKSFRLRKWMMLGNQHNLSYGSARLRVGEKVETYSEVDEDLWTPTPEYPYRGIWIGDYAIHATEFVLFHQPPRESPDGPSVLHAIKLTGDPVVKRGEISFTVWDVTPSSAIRRAPHYEVEWPNAHVFKAAGLAEKEGTSWEPTSYELDFIVPEEQTLADETAAPTYQPKTGLPHPSSNPSSSAVSLAGRDNRGRDPGAGWGVGREERDPAPKSAIIRHAAKRLERKTAPWVKREVILWWKDNNAYDMRRFKRVDVDDFFD